MSLLVDEQFFAQALDAKSSREVSHNNMRAPYVSAVTTERFGA
jgi:hypothetical protein